MSLRVIAGRSSSRERRHGPQGNTRRSLDRAVDLKSSSEGALKLTGDVIEGGASVAMTVTGRYSAQIRGSLR